MKYKFTGFSKFSIDDFECEIPEDGVAEVPFNIAHGQEFRNLVETMNAREGYGVELIDASPDAPAEDAAPAKRGKKVKADDRAEDAAPDSAPAPEGE